MCDELTVDTDAIRHAAARLEDAAASQATATSPHLDDDLYSEKPTAASAAVRDALSWALRRAEEAYAAAAHLCEASTRMASNALTAALDFEYAESLAAPEPCR